MTEIDLLMHAFPSCIEASVLHSFPEYQSSCWFLHIITCSVLKHSAKRYPKGMHHCRFVQQMINGSNPDDLRFPVHGGPRSDEDLYPRLRLVCPHPSDTITLGTP